MTGHESTFKKKKKKNPTPKKTQGRSQIYEKSEQPKFFYFIKRVALGIKKTALNWGN